MSADDEAFVERLLDAARKDSAPDSLERRTRLYDSLVRGGPPGGGGGAASPRPSGVLRGASGAARAAAIGMAILAAATLFFVMRPSSPDGATTAPPPTIVAIPVAAPIESAPVVDAPSTLGTSVWDLPGVSDSKDVVREAPQSAGANRVRPEKRVDEFDLELMALERARAKLRQGSPDDALRLLDDLDRRFPNARVKDEATVLRVQVLLALHKTAQAEALGHGFVQQHPNSIYRARLSQLLGDTTP